MDSDKQKQRRKNLLVGGTIGILVVIIYVTSIFFK
jgi:hypothetical protein